MSLLKELALKDGRIELEGEGIDEENNILGMYEGKEVKYAFQTDEYEGEDGEIVKEFRSGPYELEVENSEEVNLLNVRMRDVSEQKFQTRILKDSNDYYKLSLPARIVREVGFERVETVNGERKGVPVMISIGWCSEGFKIVLEEVSEEKLSLPNVRRVQHKVMNDYKQYYIYFPSSIPPMIGCIGERVEWGIEDGRMVGLLGREGIDVELGSEGLLRDNYYAVTFNGDPKTEKVIQVNGLEIPVRKTEETYSDVPEGKRCLSVNRVGGNELRLLLGDDQSRALGLIPGDKKELVVEDNYKGCWIVEWCEEGLLYVLYLNPERLPDERRGSNIVTLSINNWLEPLDTDESLRGKFSKAGNQVRVSIPSDAGFSFGIEDEMLYWVPSSDVLFNTDGSILVGRLYNDGK